MGKIQDSLKENLEEIKVALPGEFHEGLMAEIDAVDDPIEMSEAEVKKAVEAELIANDGVAKSTREQLCEAGIEAPDRGTIATEEEQKQQMAEMLAIVTEEAANASGGEQ